MAMGLSLGASILLGALLAPTDPVLAGDVGVGSPGEEALQREPRLSLSAEAGLNDGLAAPFLLLGILVAGNETGAIARWLVADVLYAVGVAIVVGAVGGYLAAAGSVRLRDRRFLDERLGLYAAVPIALGVYGLAELVASYGLVAAFVGGLDFRRYDFGHEINRRAYDGAEVVEKFTELTVILLLGSIVTLSGLSAPGLAGWLLAPLLLLLIRPVLVGVLLVRSDFRGGSAPFSGGSTCAAWPPSTTPACRGLGGAAPRGGTDGLLDRRGLRGGLDLPARDDCDSGVAAVTQPGLRADARGVSTQARAAIPSSRSRRAHAISAASGPLPSRPGVSSTAGRPSKRGSERNAAMPSRPSSPSPRLACRSRLEPRPVWESFTCRQRRRSRPTTDSKSSTTAARRAASLTS